MTPADKARVRFEIAHVEHHAYQLRQALDRGDDAAVEDHAAEVRRAAHRIADIAEPYNAKPGDDS